jgi:hypothetical protein
MDKLTALRTAIDEILDDDRVTHEEDGTYTVRNDSGSTLIVGRTADDWAIFFPETERIMPYSPRGERPHELVAWALQ